MKIKNEPETMGKAEKKSIFWCYNLNKIKMVLILTLNVGYSGLQP